MKFIGYLRVRFTIPMMCHNLIWWLLTLLLNLGTPGHFKINPVPPLPLDTSMTNGQQWACAQVKNCDTETWFALVYVCPLIGAVQAHALGGHLETLILIIQNSF